MSTVIHEKYLRFEFGKRWSVVEFDKTTEYRKASNALCGFKGVDLALKRGQHEFFFFEIKDYRKARPRGKKLARSRTTCPGGGKEGARHDLRSLRLPAVVEQSGLLAGYALMFSRDFGGLAKDSVWLVKGAWISFLGGVLTIIVSFITSSWSCISAIEELDEDFVEFSSNISDGKFLWDGSLSPGKRCFWSRVTTGLNVLAVVFLF